MMSRLFAVVSFESGAGTGPSWRLRLLLGFIMGLLLCFYILVLAMHP